MLQEGAADLVARLVPDPDPGAAAPRHCCAAQALLHSYGITAWQDASVGAGLGHARRAATPTSRRPTRGRTDRPGRGRAVVAARHAAWSNSTICATAAPRGDGRAGSARPP